MAPTFTELTTPRREEDDCFVAEIQDGWQQGRGAYGGLVLANLVRAAQEVAGGADRALRTVMASLLAPVLPGRAEIALEVVRAGSGTTTMRAQLAQGAETLADAVLIFGRARTGDLDEVAIARPAMPPWRDAPVLPAESLVVPFSRHFEYRVTGPAPFSAQSEGRAAGWIRPRNPGPLRDAALVVAMADVWWPTLLARLTTPRPVATIPFTVDLVGNLDGLDPEAPLFHDAHTLATRDGWSVEQRTLWGEDGRLLAINHQTFVVIR